MEWKEVDICQLCDSVSETYKGNASEVVLINTSDVLDGKCLNHEYVLNKKLKGQFKKTFRKGDILYSEIRPANKRFCFVDFEPKDYIASTKLMVLRAHEDVDPQYLYQILRSNDTLAQLQMLAESRSGTFPQITYSELSNIMVSLPSQKAQKNIVSILSSLDRKIELNNKINADLEEMAQAIFKNWFVDFEPFKDGEFVDSELGMIPEGWRVGTLGDITNNKSAKVKERNDVKVLSPVTTGELVLSEEYFTKQVFSSSIAKYKIVNKGDFAYNPARVNIGSLGRNEFDFDGCVSPVYVVFSVLEGYENYFDLFRKTDFFKDSVASLAIGGVRQSLSYDDLSSIEVIIPSENAVEEFNNLYNQMKKTIKANKLENSRLSLLRDTLLPRLMSGEIEVQE